MNLESIAILGLARSGISAAKKIKELGGDPFLSEFKSEKYVENVDYLKSNFKCEFGGHSDKLFSYKTIIVSPGIPLSVPIIRKLRENGSELISEIEFGYRIKNPQSKIIAVTGSNGKSTTVSLIAHLLRKSGLNVLLAGNIGRAFTSAPIETLRYDVVVLELSSFQLDLNVTFNADISVLLNITPDHLNRYNSFSDYINSKLSIFANSTESDVSVINADDPIIMKNISGVKGIQKKYSVADDYDISIRNRIIRFRGKEFDLDKSSLIGPHNAQNTMATLLAISDFVKDNGIIYEGLKTFVPLEHRMENCGEREGIVFINDSKATNTDATIKALQSFERKVRIILGGSDKGENFSILIPYLKNNAKKIYLIGETQEKMATAFAELENLEKFPDFDAAIRKSYLDSQKGDIILLSPACASYDSFINFEHRGKRFKELFKELTK